MIKNLLMTSLLVACSISAFAVSAAKADDMEHPMMKKHAMMQHHMMKKRMMHKKMMMHHAM